MAWYRKAHQITALRKHVMRVDLHVHAGDLQDFKIVLITQLKGAEFLGKRYDSKIKLFPDPIK